MSHSVNITPPAPAPRAPRSGKVYRRVSNIIVAGCSEQPSSEIRRDFSEHSCRSLEIPTCVSVFVSVLGMFCLSWVILLHLMTVALTCLSDCLSVRNYCLSICVIGHSISYQSILSCVEYSLLTCGCGCVWVWVRVCVWVCVCVFLV